MEIDLLKHSFDEALALVFNCKSFVNARNDTCIHVENGIANTKSNVLDYLPNRFSKRPNWL